MANNFFRRDEYTRGLLKHHARLSASCVYYYTSNYSTSLSVYSLNPYCSFHRLEQRKLCLVIKLSNVVENSLFDLQITMKVFTEVKSKTTAEVDVNFLCFLTEVLVAGLGVRENCCVRSNECLRFYTLYWSSGHSSQSHNPAPNWCLTPCLHT